MKNILLNFTLTIFLAMILDLFLPWWGIMVSAIIISYVFPLRGFKIFLIPFLAIAIYWMSYSFFLSSPNDFTLAKKIGTLFTLGENWILVLLITALIGGVAAGISGIFGKQLSLVSARKKSVHY
ncbi:hypothetical protein SAMN03097699_1512 [Flavobacteriaceae bacterium MAR_2010_188]|nr:hypothetical protein SAMN03097699_1512 [Flavobacteriaceae bacterium MAR_2010_188]